jgi:peptide/nickel transport system substrate-binding protein
MTLRWRLVIAVAGALAAVVFLMIAFHSATAARSAPAESRRVTFRVGVVESVDNLNPFIGFNSLDYLVYHLSYDFLVGWDPVKLQPRPEFAASWTQSADGKTWTFKIRPGMTWQDGAPATAHDVAFTFNYIDRNKLAAFTLYTTSIERVTAFDATTVRFYCSKPKADILYMPVPILPEHIWSKVSPQAAGTSFANGPPTIGSGPFRVVQNSPDNFVRLVANKHYWGGKPHIENLLFTTYQDANTMMQDIRPEALDAAFYVPPALMGRLASEGITTSAGTSWMSAQLAFNCYDSPNSRGNPVLRDQRFRQALQYAIDRNLIAKVAFDGYETAGTTLLPPYSEFHWQPPSGEDYTFDPAKARALLDAAGYKDVDHDSWRKTKQDKPLTLRLYAPADIPSLIAAAKLVVGWFAAVGIRVRLQVLDAAAMIAQITNREGGTFAPDFDMYVGLWQGDTEPQFIFSLLTLAQVGAWSDTSWTQPQYTRLFAAESSDIDLRSRIAEAQQLQQIAFKASPYLIFGYPEALEAYNSSTWRGYVAAPSGFPGYRGSVLSFPDEIDTYRELRPKGETPATGVSSMGWICAAIACAIAACVGPMMLGLRTHRLQVEADS